MSPMKNLSANSNQVGFTCTSFMQLQKQVIDKCKKKQFLKLEQKDVDFSIRKHKLKHFDNFFLVLTVQ